MGTFNINQIPLLSAKISRKSDLVNKVAANVVNRSATFAIRESVDEITQTVRLKPSYVKSKIKVVARASFSNLRAIISANDRKTLLTRFPHVETSTGFRVAINAIGGFREIPNARLVRLKGSGILTIGVSNKDAALIFKSSLNKGAGATPSKTAKLFRIAAKARTKPFGVTPLSSRSINQLFTSVRKNIQPGLASFMRKEFIKELRRKSL